MVKEPWENGWNSCIRPTARVRWCPVVALVGSWGQVMGNPHAENWRPSLIGPDRLRRATVLSAFSTGFPISAKLLSGVECSTGLIGHAFGHCGVSQGGMTYPGYVCREENRCGNQIVPGVVRDDIRDEKPGYTLQDWLWETAARYRTFLKEGAR